jgi:hypothetical protein
MAAYAEKHKLGQAQMLHNLIDDGLAADDVGKPLKVTVRGDDIRVKPEKASKASASRWNLDVPVGPVAQKPGSRLKGPKK